MEVLSSGDQVYPVEQERQARINNGYQALIRDLFLDDQMVLTPYQIVGSRALLDTALNNINTRERSVIVLRYSLDGNPPSTLDQVAKKLNYATRERPRQLEVKAIRKLRSPRNPQFQQLQQLVDKVGVDIFLGIKKTHGAFNFNPQK